MTLAEDYAAKIASLGKAGRPGQLTLIETGLALPPGERVLVNAPTATGKSLGALMTGGYRALKKQRTVISTYTRLLQDQYKNNDLAQAQGLFPEVTFAVLKGAANYLCRVAARTNGTGATYKTLADGSGDPGEIGGRPLWSAAADASDCGKHSPDECGYAAAKQRARAAQVVITNHALVLLNGMNNMILGPHDLLIVDEVHNFPRAAESFGTKTVDLDIMSKEFTGDNVSAEHSLLGIRSVDKLGKILAPKPDEYKPTAQQVLEAIAEFKQIPAPLQAYPEAATLKQWITAAHQQIAKPHSGLRWIATVERTLKKSRRVKMSLVDIADTAKRGLKVDLEFPSQDEDALENIRVQRAVLMMSATTGTPERPMYVAERCGVEAELVKVPSPLDYPGSMRLSTVAAGAAKSWPAVIEALVNDTEGRTLILLRSWYDVDRIADHLSYVLTVKVYQQDRENSAMNAEQVRRFREDTSSVLVGTASFFEGIDVPGESLSQVIIGKLPVKLATNPVDHERVRQWGPEFLESIQIPHTALILEQMMGRLIRSVTDRGIVAVLDDAARVSWGRQALVSAAGAFGIPLVPREEALEWFHG